MSDTTIITERDKLIRAKANNLTQIDHHQKMCEYYENEANRCFANNEISEGRKYVEWANEELRRANDCLFTVQVFEFYETMSEQLKHKTSVSGLS